MSGDGRVEPGDRVKSLTVTTTDCGEMELPVKEEGVRTLICFCNTLSDIVVKDELRVIRDNMKLFRAFDVLPLVISRDHKEDVEIVRSRENLNFPLISDVESKILSHYNPDKYEAGKKIPGFTACIVMDTRSTACLVQFADENSDVLKVTDLQKKVMSL